MTKRKQKAKIKKEEARTGMIMTSQLRKPPERIINGALALLENLITRTQNMKSRVEILNDNLDKLVSRN